MLVVFVIAFLIGTVLAFRSSAHSSLLWMMPWLVLAFLFGLRNDIMDARFQNEISVAVCIASGLLILVQISRVFRKKLS